MNVEIRGAEQLGELAKRLKAEGEAGKGLRRELLKEIRSAAKPLAEAAKSAVKALPTKPPEDTGLRRRIAAGVKVRTRTAGKQVGVRITAGKLDANDANLPRRLNKGSWRHPVFGSDTWVTQTIQPGWFDKTLRRGGPRVRLQVKAAMKRTANRIARG